MSVPRTRSCDVGMLAPWEFVGAGVIFHGRLSEVRELTARNDALEAVEEGGGLCVFLCAKRPGAAGARLGSASALCLGSGPLFSEPARPRRTETSARSYKRHLEPAERAPLTEGTDCGRRWSKSVSGGRAGDS